MERSNAGDVNTDVAVNPPDLKGQIGDKSNLAAMSLDMATHPPLPELTGTRDKQCQAFAPTSDVQCQVKELTSEVHCQVTSDVTENTQASLKNMPTQAQKHRRNKTVCSASQCRLPVPGTPLADAQSQTDMREPVTSTSSSDVSSQTDIVGISEGRRSLSEMGLALKPSSHVHSQTDMTSNCRQSPTLETDTTAVQAVCSSLDAMNQTDGLARFSNKNSEDAATMTSGRSGGHNLARLDHRVQTSNSRDFQCQTWPESCEAESQAGTHETF